MLKKILKAIRRRLLKIKWFKREVDRWKLEQQKRENRKRFAHLMHAGKTVHTEDKSILIDYTANRMMGQRGFAPQFYNPKIWQELIRNQSDIDRDNARSKLSLPEGSSDDSAGVGPSNTD